MTLYRSLLTDSYEKYSVALFSKTLSRHKNARAHSFFFLRGFFKNTKKLYLSYVISNEIKSEKTKGYDFFFIVYRYEPYIKFFENTSTKLTSPLRPLLQIPGFSRFSKVFPGAGHPGYP